MAEIFAPKPMPPRRRRIITLTMEIDVTDSPERTIHQDVEDILVHALRNHDRPDVNSGAVVTIPFRRMRQCHPNTYRIEAHYARDGVEYQISDEAAWGPR